jgi:predicted DNA-binding transcriptional regulator AlpA
MVEAIGKSPEVNSERLVSLAETAGMLGGVSVKTVRRMIAAGELPPAVKVLSCSKLPLSEVQSCIERLKQQRTINGGRR